MYNTIPRLSVVAAWAPRAPLLATSSLAGSLGADFDASSRLEVYSINNSAQALASVELNDKTRAIGWGAGLIAVALEGGELQLWDSARLLDGAGAQALSSDIKHEGAIHSIDFNGSQEGLMASGGTGGELLVWDVLAASGPKPHAPGTASQRPQNQQPVVAVHWNPKVPRILAAAAGAAVAVWDLRAQKPVGLLSDRRLPAVSSVCWHNDTSTLLATASSDERSATVVLWDMRGAQQPLAVLDLRRPVRSVAWSPHCNQLLLAATADGRVQLWSTADAHSPALASDLQAGGSLLWAGWSPAVASVVAVTAADGPVRLLSAHDPCASAAQRVVQAPSWLKRQAGVTMAGGRLVHFSAASRQLRVRQLCEAAELTAAAQRLDAALSSPEAAADFCRQRQQSAASAPEAEHWALLCAASCDRSPAALVAALGLSADSVHHAIASINWQQLQEEQQPAEAPPEAEAVAVESPSPAATEDSSAGSSSDGVAGLFGAAAEDDVFARLTGTTASDDFPDWTSQQQQQSAVSPSEAPTGTAPPLPPLRLHSDDPIEDAMTLAVAAGDWTAAVDCARRAGRWADALALAASSGSHELLASARAAYLSARSRSSASAAATEAALRLRDGDESAAVEVALAAAQAGDWRRALAAVAAHRPAAFAQAASATAAKLRSSGDQQAAVCAAIVAGDAEAVADFAIAASADRSAAISAAVERAAVLAPPPPHSRKLQALYADYADLVARAGALAAGRRFGDSLPKPSTQLSNSSQLPLRADAPSPFAADHQQQHFASHFAASSEYFGHQPIADSHSIAAFGHSAAFQSQPPLSQQTFQHPPAPTHHQQPQPVHSPTAANSAFSASAASAFAPPSNPPPQAPAPVATIPTASSSTAAVGVVRREAAASLKSQGLQRLVEFASQLPADKQSRFLSDFTKRLHDIDANVSASAQLTNLIEQLANALTSGDSAASASAFQSLTVTHSELLGASGVVAIRRLKDATRQ